MNSAQGPSQNNKQKMSACRAQAAGVFKIPQVVVEGSQLGDWGRGLGLQGRTASAPQLGRTGLASLNCTPSLPFPLRGASLECSACQS